MALVLLIHINDWEGPFLNNGLLLFGIQFLLNASRGKGLANGLQGKLVGTSRGVEHFIGLCFFVDSGVV